MKRVALILAGILIWTGCGYIDYGYTLGYFTHHYPQGDHRGRAIGMSLVGPLALPASLGNTPRHWLTKPLSTEERWKAFHEEFPSLDRAEFERTYN